MRDQLKPGAHVLDVGSGSGYLTACFYRYVKSKGENANTRIVGIEHQASLVAMSKTNLNADDSSMLESGNMLIVEGDGRKGHPALAPYDAIHVGAAAPDTPTELINQLANGGRLIVPVGPEGGTQYMQQVYIVVIYGYSKSIDLFYTSIVRQGCQWQSTDDASNGRHVRTTNGSTFLTAQSVEGAGRYAAVWLCGLPIMDILSLALYLPNINSKLECFFPC